MADAVNEGYQARNAVQAKESDVEYLDEATEEAAVE
jgi:hypothetical protein